MNDQALFILAPPRSFASVTCAMIGNHPHLFGLAETNLFVADTVDEFLRVHETCPRRQHGLMRCIAELGFGEQTEETIHVAKDWLESNREVTTAAVFRDLCAWASPLRVIHRSPVHAYSRKALARIRAAFPQARYLHLLRHPRSTCESAYRFRQQAEERSPLARRLAERRGSRFFDRPADGELTPKSMWLRPHLCILEHLEHVPMDRKMRLRGEDLLDNPGLYLAQIAQWLGIGHEPSDVEAILHPERSPFACFGPSNAKWGNDSSFMEKPELRPSEGPVQGLDEPLSWNKQLGFSEMLKSYAVLFGYE